MNDISVVINYCSLEREFLNGRITESLKFSEYVVVSFGSLSMMERSKITHI